MRYLIAPLVALALCACAATGPEVVYSTRPPVQYRHDARLDVLTASEAGVSRACPPVAGVPKHIGCETPAGTIILPNPCIYDDFYALLFCHELGHFNKWPGNHPSS